MTLFDWKPRESDRTWVLPDNDKVLETIKYDHDTAVYRDSKGAPLGKRWDDARAAVERRFKKGRSETPDDTNFWSTEYRYRLIERWNTHQFDGGLPEDEAFRLAVIDLRKEAERD